MTHFFPEPENDEEGQLFKRVGSWNGPPGLAALTSECLRELTAREGCDFATALLHRRIVESDAHGPFLRWIKSGEIPSPTPIQVAIVPGAFYRENPHTGADGRLPREVAQGLGLPVTTVPVSSSGRLLENASLLTAWLQSYQGPPLILVSVSKAGGDIKTALAQPDAARTFANVRGWINICGILDGTPMADWLLSETWLARANRFYYRMRGRSLDFLDDLRPGEGSALNFPLVLPPGLRAVHIVGFPLRRHLHNGLARRCHERLEPYGPNDGSVVLSNVLHWPGQLCPVWGADHYLRPKADVRPLLAALFATLSA